MMVGLKCPQRAHCQHTHTCRRFQLVLELPAYPRGCHIITRKISEAMPELGQMEVGMANLFSEWRCRMA